MVVSHSYVVRENYKNMTALAELAEVRVAMPDRYGSMFGGLAHAETGQMPGAAVYRRISLPRAQFFLASRDLGLREFQPDVINVEYDPWSAIFWQVLLYRCLFARHAKLVCTVKKNTYRRARWPAQWIKDFLFRLMQPSVSRFLAVNRGVARIYHEHFGIAAARIVTMTHLATDTELFHPSETSPGLRDDGTLRADRPFVIGYAGRLAGHKGVTDLVAACTAIQADGIPIRLLLLGGGPLADSLASMSLAWMSVEAPVEHAAVADFLHRLDLFVMPARITPDHEEHDGHAVMEALACGVPCLGSTSGVLPELVSPDYGYMFRANDVGDLEAKLRAIIAAPDRHAALAMADRARAVELFSLNRVARQRHTLFESLIA